MRMINLTKIATSWHNDNEEGEGQPTSPVAVNADAIRCFYPRRENLPGTRITFMDGGGFVVLEDFGVVSEKVLASA